MASIGVKEREMIETGLLHLHLILYALKFYLKYFFFTLLLFLFHTCLNLLCLVCVCVGVFVCL